MQEVLRREDKPVDGTQGWKPVEFCLLPQATGSFPVASLAGSISVVHNLITKFCFLCSAKKIPPEIWRRNYLGHPKNFNFLMNWKGENDFMATKPLILINPFILAFIENNVLTSCSKLIVKHFKSRLSKNISLFIFLNRELDRNLLSPLIDIF